jgi:hypothetical protein
LACAPSTPAIETGIDRKDPIINDVFSFIREGHDIGSTEAPIAWSKSTQRDSWL